MAVSYDAEGLTMRPEGFPLVGTPDDITTRPELLSQSFSSLPGLRGQAEHPSLADVFT